MQLLKHILKLITLLVLVIIDPLNSSYRIKQLNDHYMVMKVYIGLLLYEYTDEALEEKFKQASDHFSQWGDVTITKEIKEKIGYDVKGPSEPEMHRFVPTVSTPYKYYIQIFSISFKKDSKEYKFIINGYDSRILDNVIAQPTNKKIINKLKKKIYKYYLLDKQGLLLEPNTSQVIYNSN